jgi:hypothetical protein
MRVLNVSELRELTDIMAKPELTPAECALLERYSQRLAHKWDAAERPYTVANLNLDPEETGA